MTIICNEMQPKILEFPTTKKKKKKETKEKKFNFQYVKMLHKKHLISGIIKFLGNSSPR